MRIQKTISKVFFSNSLRAIAMAAGLGLMSSAQAQLLKITPGATGSVLTTDELLAAFTDALEAEVNASLPSVETGQYSKGMANATAMSSSSSGVIYGTPFSMALVGVNAGAAVDLGEGNSLGGFDPQKVAGFSPQAGVILGFNPGVISSSPWGPIDPTKVSIFVTYMALAQKVDNIDVDFANFALIGKYQLLEGKSLGMSALKWNGVEVLSGYRFSKMRGTMVEDFDMNYDDGFATAEVTGPVTIGADVKVHTIPLEASTSVRVAYFLNFIGGAAFDFNFGSSTAIGDYDANITISDGSTATGDLDVGTDTKPSALNIRTFGGLGIEFGIGSLNLILGKSITGGAWNFNGALGFFW